MDAAIDKTMLKEALRELIQEEPDTFRNMLREIFTVSKNQEDDEFEQLIQRNFQRFDDTFRALA